MIQTQPYHEHDLSSTGGKKRRVKHKRRDAPGKGPVERRGQEAVACGGRPVGAPWTPDLPSGAFPKGAPWEGKTNRTGLFAAGVVFLRLKVAMGGSTNERQTFEHGLPNLCWRLKVIHV